MDSSGIDSLMQVGPQAPGPAPIAHVATGDTYGLRSRVGLYNLPSYARVLIVVSNLVFLFSKTLLLSFTVYDIRDTATR